MKSRYIAKRYWKDQSTPMGKVDALAKNYDDVINLSLGDPDLTTHKLIITKAFEDACAGHTKYTDFRGDPELRQEISKSVFLFINSPTTQTNQQQGAGLRFCALLRF